MYGGHPMFGGMYGGHPMFGGMYGGHPMFGGHPMMGRMGFGRRGCGGRRRGGRCGPRRGHCGPKGGRCAPKDVAPKKSEEPAKPVPDVATREQARNDRAIAAAIAASVDSFEDELLKRSQEKEEEVVHGETESKCSDDEEDINGEDSISETFESIPTMEEKWATELAQLAAVGFDDKGKNIELLEEKNGVVKDVLQAYFK